MVLLARGSQYLSIDLIKIAHTCSTLGEWLATKLCAAETATQGLAGCRKELEGKAWKQSVPDVEPLRDGVEGEGDERPVGCGSFLGLLQRSLQKLIAKPAPLLVGRNE